MTKRKFGVEVECGHPDYYYETVARQIRELKLPGVKQRVDCDGSGIEVKTEPLSGHAGFKALRGLFEYLNDDEFYVTANDGLHVHVDAPEFRENRPRQLQLVQSWHNNQLHVCKFVDSDRATKAIDAIGNDDDFWGPDSPCPLWSEADVKRVLTQGHQAGPRGALNIHSLGPKGTVEFRLHEGTLDYEKAEAWVKFCLAFVNHVVRLKQPMKTAHDPANLIRRVRAPKVSARMVPA